MLIDLHYYVTNANHPAPESVMNRIALALAPLAGLALASAPTFATAAEISTHVLDLAKGVGGRDVPVVLLRKATDGTWSEVARARTDENGRVRAFGANNFEPGTYKLQFDMTGYPAPQASPFFPEIDLVFAVSDKAAHYHVPVVVSPYGYSTYRGN
ncbi:hypothetical protein L284_06085 [Novosphingobium lindaniclasticum LE124]|uniref:5-hydroxyisourate hydrolase n=2 Tax=Novosphingobium TaxID=165696 RepID=T0J1F8_9SPHN|nr:hypothetical protein L284_06085 [Novosphingobium lindaniclasticum LE124]